MKRVKIAPYKLRAYYYRKNVSARMAADHFGVSPTTIRKYLKLYGFRIKRRSEIMKDRTLSEEHKSKIVKFLNNF